MKTAGPVFLIVLCCSTVLSASDWTVDLDDGWCEREAGRERYCEVREATLVANRDVIAVDGLQNGGIQVDGWERNEILLRAKIQLWGDDDAVGAEDAKEIEIHTDGDTIRASAPALRRHKGWSVSYRLMVPRYSNLELETTNGGIRLSGLDGELRFRATNGGIHLEDVAGDFRGRTSNGGLQVDLAGDSWLGEALDVETTNGGVHLTLPEYYSAELITGTVNGRLDVELPIEIGDSKSKRIETTLGRGGAKVRVITTNGGVVIRER